MIEPEVPTGHRGRHTFRSQKALTSNPLFSLLRTNHREVCVSTELHHVARRAVASSVAKHETQAVNSLFKWFSAPAWRLLVLRVLVLRVLGTLRFTSLRAPETLFSRTLVITRGYGAGMGVGDVLGFTDEG